MKSYKLKIVTLAVILFTAVDGVYAQSINWLSQSQEKSKLVYLNIGYEFSLNTQIGFAQSVKAFKPLLLTADYSFPMGDQLFDDHKIRIGAQLSVLEKNNFMLSVGYRGIIRRQETKLVRLLNLGSEFSIDAGYYKAKWFVATRIGYDQALLTHAKHTDVIRENYPSIADAWYKQTGGYFYYGLEGGKSIGKRMDMTLSVGAVNAKGKDQNPILPVYAKLGLFWNFSKSKK